MSHLRRAREVFDIEIAALKAAREHLDEAFNRAPTASTTAMLAMGDALAMAILQARGFTERDFAKHHPAGAVGRALLLKISDIMRAGERNPVAPQTASVKEGLLVMTRHKA